jgi:hypothetical protein
MIGERMMPPVLPSDNTRVPADTAAAAAPASRPSSSRAVRGTRRTAKRRTFYIMTGTTTARASGFKLLNERRLFHGGPAIFVPPPGRRGFRDYPELPVFLSDVRLGRNDRDFEEDCEYWFISDRMKAVLESVDPEAFAFLKCKVQLPDGTDGPLRWLCDVVRVLDALDEEKSTITKRAASDGGEVYSFFGEVKLIFKEEVVDSSHIFRMEYFDAKVICDEKMRLACKAADLTGLRFINAAKRGI